MPNGPPPVPVGREVVVNAAGVELEGELVLPEGAEALVLFAHGSGSSRFSPRNRAVAEVLQAARLGTLLFDLLTSEEDLVDRITAGLRFDIPLLAERLAGATDWVLAGAGTGGLRLGYFGASTGAAAALIAAADRPAAVGAVVSRGGRPDLAAGALRRVRAPTLLVVGERDAEVLALNREALAVLGAANRLEVVAGATHLFEEPGTLNTVAELARDWFLTHLIAGGA